MDILTRLGVKKYINAHDTYTVYGGSRMSAASLKAMEEAAHWFVDIDELQAAIGDRIAGLTKNEGAYVTNGASGGLLLAAAACMTKGDPYRFTRLPKTGGVPDEIIVMRCQHNAYDKAIEGAGARIVEIGDADETLAWELEGAITDQTAAVFYFASLKYAPAALSLEETIEIAHRYSVPVVVDAAAQLPPVENLWRFSQAGADMTIFSGGKTLCGPQASGLVVGKKEWIAACRKIGAPVHGVCRSSKVGREEMCALLVALEEYLALDHRENLERLYRIDREIGGALEQLGCFQTYLVDHGPVGQTYPRLFAKITADFSALELAALMRQQDPGVYIGTDPSANEIYISPLNLRDDEIGPVIEAFRRCSSSLAGSQPSKGVFSCDM